MVQFIVVFGFVCVVYLVMREKKAGRHTHRHVADHVRATHQRNWVTTR